MKKGRVVGLVIAMVLSLVEGYSLNDSLKTREYLALYQDELRMENYGSAMTYLEWLMENQPGMYKKFYIDAVKIYDSMSKSSETEASLYQDKVVWAYRERVKYFGEEPKVLNYLFLKSYQYYRKDSSRYIELLELFDQSLELNNEKLFSANILAYVDLLNLSLTEGLIHETEVLERIYAIDQQFAVVLKEDEKYFSKYQALTIHLIKNEKFNCEILENWISVQKESFTTSGLINNFLIQRSCTDSDQYYLILHDRAVKEKNLRLIDYLAKIKIRDKEFESALHLLNTATGFTDDPEEKSRLYLSMSRIELNRGNYLAAYQFAEQAKLFHSSAEVWKQLGDIFMNSYKQCRKGDNEIIERLCFIIAYTYYEKADDTKRMELSKEQLPTISNLHLYNLEAGDSLVFDCWTKRKVTLLTRD